MNNSGCDFLADRGRGTAERERDKWVGGAEATPTKQLLQGSILMHPSLSLSPFLSVIVSFSTDLATLPPLDIQTTSEAGLTGMDHCSQSLSQFIIHKLMLIWC